VSNGAVVAGAAAQQIAANAIKASGAIVRVESGDFEAILKKSESPLVVYAQGGVFTTKYRYLTPYKGLVFFTVTQTPLMLPSRAEVIAANRIWIPE
jgi:tRNA U34 2-thiouridine synthase MnmA/TrmU